jgi:penicillin-binding protein 1A
MAELGHIGQRDLRRARRAPLGITSRPPKPAVRQPYFVEAVKNEVLSDGRLGTTEQDRARALFKGGLRIATTLEPRLQRAAEQAIAGVLDRPGDPAAALVAIEPRTGAIVAMVGGEDWSTSQVNLALGAAGGGSGRQPGSAFKPIVAAAGLENRILLGTRYESSPVTFRFQDGSTWSVGNAEGGGSGLLSIEEGLVHSVNGVFARLAVELGPGQIATQARLMGVRSKLPNYPSIALGSAEVSVLDMGAAYATLASGGVAIEPTTIRAIRLPDGEVLQPDQKRVEGALSPGNAYLLTKALEEVIVRGTGTAAAIGRPAAGKTGTTNDYADAWFVGYTPDLVAAVWVGYPQGRIPMTSVHGTAVEGGTFPAHIWRAFMLEALKDRPARDFELPKTELVTVEIDPASGLLAAPWCPGEPKTMLRQLVPEETCPLPPPAPTPTPTPTPAPENQGRSAGDEDPSPKPGPTSSPGPRATTKPSPQPSGKQSPEPGKEASPRPSPTK